MKKIIIESIEYTDGKEKRLEYHKLNNGKEFYMLKDEHKNALADRDSEKKWVMFDDLKEAKNAFNGKWERERTLSIEEYFEEVMSK